MATSSMRTPERVHAVLSSLADRYPPEMVEGQRRDIERMAFSLGLLAELPDGARVADIGGGLGLFSPACAAMGFSSVLVDDFQDRENILVRDGVFGRIHTPDNVEIVSRDVVADGVAFPADSLDAVTIFDSMEHWHHSPRRVLRQLVAALKPGGLLVIGVPNCVNLRKRLTVPLGRGKWSPMSEWYEQDVFRGHVREPDVDDLRHIARDLGLTDSRIIGRNWLGLDNNRAWIRAASKLVDLPMQAFPQLCANIYLVGRKPV